MKNLEGEQRSERERERVLEGWVGERKPDVKKSYISTVCHVFMGVVFLFVNLHDE